MDYQPVSSKNSGEESVTAFIHKIFRTETIPKHMNHSLICLILKVTHLKFMIKFSLIYLNNVIIKVVSKVIVNCLKPLMNDLTGPYQASFIPRRQTTDNIVIVQEALHSLKWRK